MAKTTASRGDKGLALTVILNAQTALLSYTRQACEPSSFDRNVFISISFQNALQNVPPHPSHLASLKVEFLHSTCPHFLFQIPVFIKPFLNTSFALIPAETTKYATNHEILAWSSCQRLRRSEKFTKEMIDSFHKDQSRLKDSFIPWQLCISCGSQPLT